VNEKINDVENKEEINEEKVCKKINEMVLGFENNLTKLLYDTYMGMHAWDDNTRAYIIIDFKTTEMRSVVLSSDTEPLIKDTEKIVLTLYLYDKIKQLINNLKKHIEIEVSDDVYLIEKYYDFDELIKDALIKEKINEVVLNERK